MTDSRPARERGRKRSRRQVRPPSRQAADVQDRAGEQDGSPRRVRIRLLLLSLVLVATTLFVYTPALRGGFLFDDDSLVSRSAIAQAPDGLRRIWLTTEPLDYWPVTNSSFWLEWRLWGMNPMGYHVTNVALHIGSAVLLWAILCRLSIPGAWLAAMLFAVHPVNVQSVAWIAQRKNTLSMVFFLSSILWYLAAIEHEAGGRTRAGPDSFGWRWYWLSFAAFVLAMLSKGSVAILPGVLLLLVWWRRAGIGWRDVARVVPFFVVAIVLTVVNVWFQARMPGGARDVTGFERLLGAGAVIWFYLEKALVPVGLMFVYPQWEVRADDWRWWAPALAAMAVTAVLVWQRRHAIDRAILFAWIFFCLALIPVMGLTDVYFMKYSLVADHYEYVALAGVAAAVAAGLVRVLEPLEGVVRPRLILATAWRGVLIVVLAVVAWSQAHVFATPEVFYRAGVSRNPSAWVLQNNLGALLIEQSKDEEAAAHLREALRLHPDFPQARNNLCDAAAHLRRVDEALAECSAAVRNDPSRASAQDGLGVALASTGRFAEARAAFETALRLNPDLIEARYHLADVLEATGQPGEAASHYRTVLRAWPDSAGAHNGLGRALEDLGDLAGADAAFRDAIRLDPAAGEPHRNLADLLAGQGRFEDAVGEYRQALAHEAPSADVRNNLGVALARLGRVTEAAQEFQAALVLDPSLQDARANLEKLTRQAPRGRGDPRLK